jgi:hypothetical protein
MLIFRMAYAGSPSGAGDSGFHSPNMQNGVIRLGRVALGITAANDAMGRDLAMSGSSPFWRNSVTATSHPFVWACPT